MLDARFVGALVLPLPHNPYAQRVNQAILRAQGSANPANELADQRDVKLARLAELTGAAVIHREDGTVDVTLAGSMLVVSFVVSAFRGRSVM